MKKKHWCLVLGFILFVMIGLLVSGILGNNLFTNKYSWEYYQSLTLEEQDEFFQSFESEEAFEEWMNKVNPNGDDLLGLTWKKSSKKPDAYNWEEYQNLNREEKDAFFRWFESEEAFEVWMNQTKPNDSGAEILAWDETKKSPKEHTWAEYQALSSAEQESFFQWFESADAFEVWMIQVKPEEEPAAELVWGNSDKQPNEYTWAEYQALSPEKQEAFFQWFESVKAFEEWMNQVKPGEEALPEFTWDNPDKQPNEYTWVEYQALSSEEQEAFFQWFGSMEAFEEWMNSVKN